ncbi:MAG: DUF58 domain-containing protein [Blastocatellia bacterium]|nr:DUF58 domain-containing protein [Blastocatellia bacterium]
MFHFLKQKQSLRFLLTMVLLTTAAVGAMVVSELANRVGNVELESHSAKLAVVLAVIIVAYVVIKLAQSASLQSEYSLQVTMPGLVFSLLILLVVVLSLSSGNNLLYLFLSILLATMFVSLVGSRLSLSRVRISVRYPDHIFAGEQAPFDVTITNRKRLLPAFSVGVAILEASAGASEEPRLSELCYVPIIPPGAEAVSRQVRVFAKRGVHPIRGIVLGTRFPLGFIEQRRLVDAEGEVVVYPTPATADRFELLVRQAQGKIESRMRGAGSDLHAIRQYQTSDHHHHIDWKATAKTSVLMVREFTRDDDWRVTVAFDAVVDPELAAEEGFPERFERAIAFTAGLLKRFIDEGADARLVCGGQDTGFAGGEQHLYKMLRLLAEAAPVTAPPAGETPSDDLPADESSRILITPRVGETGSAEVQAIGYDEV